MNYFPFLHSYSALFHNAHSSVANDINFDKSNTFDLTGLAFGKELNYNIYLGGRYTEMKNIVWTNLALFDEGQLRQRIAW